MWHAGDSGHIGLKPLYPRDMQTIRDYKDEGSIGAGVGIGLGLNVAVFTVLLLACTYLDSVAWLAQIFYAGAFGIGLTQLLYIVPLYIHYRKKEQKNTAKGLVIAASIIALLNVTCWGIVSNMRF